MKIEITGTGNAGQIPVWGCHCPACDLALNDSRHRRRASTLAIHTEQGITLLDAGLVDLHERYAFEQIQQVILTHYHMDHVQGLFHLRWSERQEKIPVYGPNDSQGADDLFKHPGVFQFQPPLAPFTPIDFGEFTLTAVPLNHSRPTYGYLITTATQKTAYLTDTAGLPENTEQFLKDERIDTLIIDCTNAPRKKPSNNHNDLNMVVDIVNTLQPKSTLLTHISHTFQCWLMENDLPRGIGLAEDGLVITES